MRRGCYSIALTLFVAFASCGSAAEVRLRSSAVCASSVVRLADIAEIHAAEPDLSAALSDIPLCAAPAKGSERQFTQHEVRQLLALSGVEAATQVTGSERVAILTEGSGILAHSKRPRTAFATHRQAAFEAELTAGEQSRARQAPKPLVRPAAKSTDEPPLRLVERGALCTVHARAGSIRVTMPGKAMQAGALGETISVELDETKERVLARIVGSQVVEVAVAGGGGALRPSSTLP
jgi:Chaperone for flagella basal body P-ring formation